MILVVGATGMMGGTITRRLLERGESVRILVRPGSPYQPLLDARVQPVFGDLKEPASLVPACAGIDAVITTASAGSRGGDDTPEAVDLKGNRNLIEAARAAGIRQLVFISTIVADETSPNPILAAKATTERYLLHSGVPYTILKADTLMDLTIPLVVGGPALSGQPVVLVGGGRRRHSFVAIRDVAAFAVASIGRPEAINQQIVIGGPEALSFRDVVATYERALGRQILVQTIAPGELLPNLPSVPGLAEVISQMAAALDLFDSPIDMSETATRFGVTLTPLDELVREQIAGTAQGVA